jgi:hypothetical protein
MASEFESALGSLQGDSGTEMTRGAVPAKITIGRRLESAGTARDAVIPTHAT